MENAVRKELQTWLGNEVQEWKHLHTRQIEYALPNQARIKHSITNDELTLRKGLYVSGDHLLNGSLNAAMKIGEQVGDLVSSNI